VYEAVIVQGGQTVTDAAARLQMSRPSLSNVVNGNAALSIELALRIEREFGLDARKLLVAQLDEDIAKARSA
jgi:addiction module HigA family antidote